MRSAVAVLLITLLGPSMLNVVCELTCVQQEHHAAETAAEENCHDQGSSSHQTSASIDGRAIVCHEDAEGFTGTKTANVRIQSVEPVNVDAPLAFAADHPSAFLVLRPPSFSRPRIVHQTTPLRI